MLYGARFFPTDGDSTKEEWQKIAFDIVTWIYQWRYVNTVIFIFFRYIITVTGSSL